MKREVRLTESASSDVGSILRWLKARSPQGAATWRACLEGLLRELESGLRAWPLAPEADGLGEPLYQALFRTPRGRPYRVLFVIRSVTVFVVHLRGPGQDLLPSDELQLPDRS